MRERAVKKLSQSGFTNIISQQLNTNQEHRILTQQNVFEGVFVSWIVNLFLKM